MVSRTAEEARVTMEAEDKKLKKWDKKHFDYSNFQMWCWLS